MRGPFTKTSGAATSGDGFYREWYRQDIGAKKRKPLPYLSYGGTTSGWKTKVPGDWAGTSQFQAAYGTLSGSWVSYNLLNTQNLVSNKALAKLQKRILEESSAQLGNAIGEWRQAASMIENRALQLYRLLKAVKRRDLKGFVANLSTHTGETVKKKTTITYRSKDGRILKKEEFEREIAPIFNHRDKRWADRWLELHFGWAPLVDDITGAIQVFTTPLRERYVTAKAEDVVNAARPEAGYLPSISIALNIYVKMGCSFAIANDNIDLAARLGLLNPAPIAWELTPWSFLIDHFVNVGQFLEQMTPLAGISLSDPYTTIYRRCKGFNARTTEENPTSNYRQFNTGFWMSRTLSLPSFRLVIKPQKGLSLTRAATYIALLVQILHGANPGTRY